MAFRVTKQLMAAPTRKDTHPALRKLYSKYFYENGMVTRHLSPFEQDVLGPWLKAMPQKLARRAKLQGPYLVFVVGALYFATKWGEKGHDDIARAHRD